jgi:hypothetical protein
MKIFLLPVEASSSVNLKSAVCCHVLFIMDYLSWHEIVYTVLIHEKNVTYISTVSFKNTQCHIHTFLTTETSVAPYVSSSVLHLMSKM